MNLTDAAFVVAEKKVKALARHECTRERFRQIAEETAGMFAFPGAVSVDEILSRLEYEYTFVTPHAIVVEDPDKHVQWLEERREEIDFAYWRRYEEWLQKRGRRSGARASLAETTDRILGLLENPHRSGTWRNYGMVFGQVQSGKTANYTGVICKAVDAGYRVIIVLTSQHESLRHQTQARLDTEFLGFNSRFMRDPNVKDSAWVGVGTLHNRVPPAQAITTQKGDFTTAQFKGLSVDIKQMPVLAVVKKNSRILGNLRDWLRNLTPAGSDTIQDAPMLLIDDEADYGSVDTKRPRGGDLSDPDHDPTAINARIRELLGLFDRSAYLAYTATPFANIFINGDTDHSTYGKDLFPSSFIVALETSSDYCGPEVVFGLQDDSLSIEARKPLPTIRTINDHTTWMPDRHQKGHRPDVPLPGSLVEALDAFVLATAVRRRREEQEKGAPYGHNTMLVHVTRFTDVQGEVARQIENHLRAMAGSWGDYGHAGLSLRGRLRELWHRDFEQTYEAMAGRDDVGFQLGVRLSWSDVEAHVSEVLEDVANGVKRINGTAEDVLEYELTTPATVVAVGGDKLSRGLTLEGLTVSYYLRASRTYDTLLQMGRWFGYRPGYLDATRLYTTSGLLDNYVHITRANRELMDLVSAMSRAGQTPRTVGMRVLDGTGSLSVTAAAKMRSTRTLMVSLAGERAETLNLLTDADSQQKNLQVLQEMMEKALPFRVDPTQNEVQGIKTGLLFRNVPPVAVTDFLEGYAASSQSLTGNPENVRDYINSQVARDELTSWTIAIAGGRSRNHPLLTPLGEVPLVQRNKVAGDDHSCTLNVLVSPEHEELGLTSEQIRKAKKKTGEQWRSEGRNDSPKRARARVLREQRSPQEGLLIIYPIDPDISEIKVGKPELPVIGYAVCFPKSDRAARINYRVNRQYLEDLRRSVSDEEDEA